MPDLDLDEVIQAHGEAISTNSEAISVLAKALEVAPLPDPVDSSALPGLAVAGAAAVLGGMVGAMLTMMAAL